ncbi:thymidylate synthase [Klebsiella michiganensis]|uniref:Thymidylate synthase n=1 Tax=Klebsiella michiganensis TaxID=1134687 RepID=A0A7H4M6V5_9ENTR|nr:thymidylate synthase [Klebsiella michiganensis]
MKQYLDLMQKVLDEGTQKNDRTVPHRLHLRSPDAF